MSSLSRAMRVTLRPGDMLYLPSLWYAGNEPLFTVACELTEERRYHKVSQTCGPEGICVAVNYWFVYCSARSQRARKAVTAHRFE